MFSLLRQEKYRSTAGQVDLMTFNTHPKQHLTPIGYFGKGPKFVAGNLGWYISHRLHIA